jgi:hypothetical protein
LRRVGVGAGAQPSLEVIEAADAIEPASERVEPFENFLPRDDPLFLPAHKERIDLAQLHDGAGKGRLRLLAAQADSGADASLALPIARLLDLLVVVGLKRGVEDFADLGAIRARPVEHRHMPG